MTVQTGPVIAVAGVAFDDYGRVLLIQRATAPNRGLWTVPGGRVGWGEKLVDAAKREFREETGLDAHIGPMITVVERMSPPEAGEHDAYHFVIVDYLVTATFGELEPGSDAADARWVELDRLSSLSLTEGLEPVIIHAAGLAANLSG